eukprot:SM000107S14094  [mRNA]  locus=s107:309038:310568:- [translate_table: standard]
MRGASGGGGGGPAPAPAPPPQPLRNEYWALRHGRSLANERGIIVSDLRNGVKDEFGLAHGGRLQAAQAGSAFCQVARGRLQDTWIFSSPFSRTLETARIVAQQLGWEENDTRLQVREELRERYFGPALELGLDEQYADVWAMDGKDPAWCPEGGESVTSVARRILDLLQALEVEYQEQVILLVSHGDVLQILQAALAGQQSGLCNHRSFAMATGELRAISFT